jgi:hypothetical protein
MVAPLIKHIKHNYQFSDLCIIFSGTPTNEKQEIFKASVKTELKQLNISKPHTIHFPHPKSDRFLDVVDYASWAIYRKWENEDTRSYELIADQIRKPELDIFKNGDGTEYY